MEDSEINKTLKLYLDNNLNKAEVGRAINLSRERIGQVLKLVNGTKDPLVNFTSKLDWEAYRGLCKTFGISHQEIAKRAGCYYGSMAHILRGDISYTKNSYKSRNSKAVLVAKAILEISQEKCEYASLVFDKIDENITNLLEDKEYEENTGRIEKL